jgi:hypothetical protein
MTKPYRPRLPEVIALIEAMPGTDRDLQPYGGHDLKWTQQKLSALLNRGVITRRHDVYSKIAEYEPSFTLQVLDAMQTFGPLTRKDVAALGVHPRSACSILTDLERRGIIAANPVAKPLRFELVRGLERLAHREANR